jgi:hypothetical protein
MEGYPHPGLVRLLVAALAMVGGCEPSGSVTSVIGEGPDTYQVRWQHPIPDRYSSNVRSVIDGGIAYAVADTALIVLDGAAGPQARRFPAPLRRHLARRARRAHN